MTKEFLSPSDVKDLESKKRVITDEDVEFESEETSQKKVSAPNPSLPNQPKIKAINIANQVKIDFETMGRFDTPSSLSFSGYTVDHIDNFALVTEDNILETLVSITEELKDKNSSDEIGNMLIEEYFEVLIGIESRFNTVNHMHRWVCDCQRDVDENSRIINETIIHLPSLQFTSIEQADEKLKEICRESFETEGVFKNYLSLKYGEDASIEEFNKEDEISKMKVSEPYSILDENILYKFRYLRIKDLLFANEYVNKKYAGKIKAIKNKQIHNVKAFELKQIKEDEMEALTKKKNQEFLRALRKCTLVEYNGKQLFELEDKMEVQLPINVALKTTDFLDKLKFGVTHKQDFDCPICGKSEQRSLYLEFNFIEFVPVKLDPRNEVRGITGGNIFMGI